MRLFLFVEDDKALISILELWTKLKRHDIILVY